MKATTLEYHVRTLNGILASFAHSKATEGQYARERIAVESIEKARDVLLEELRSRDVVQPK